MSVQEFFRKMKDIRLSLSRNGDKLILKKDGRVVSAKDREIIENNRDLISYIREHRSELLEYVPLANKDWSDRKAEGIQSMYRLSGVQEGMLFHSLYEVGGDIYIEQYTCELRNITAEVFVRSWQLLTRKHSIFRTAFYYDRFKIPVQCVHKQVEMPVHISDIRHLDPSEQQAHMNAYMRQDLERGFDPQTPPLMRVALFRLDEERYCMLWTFHHILLDGWSMQVLKQEFRNLCSLLLKGHIILDEEDRFEDYIRWIERQDKEKEKSYWTRYLKDVDHPSLLPFIEDRLEKTKGVGRYKYIELELDRSLTRALNGYVRGCRVTMNTLMLGVWAYLLYRYTSHEHILFGVTVAGRPEDLPDVERRLGLYINTIPFYTRVEESLLIMEWLAGIQQDQLLSRQYQYTSLGDIRKWKKLQGDLFDCLVVFENYPVGEKADEDTSTPHLSNEQMQEHTNYPLCLSIAGSDRLYVSFEYNADVLNEQYVQQASDHFKYVLEQIVVDGRERICDLRLLSEKHLHGVMEMSKGEDIVYDREKTLVDLFVEQVLRTPEAVALVSGEAEVSYRELEDRSNRLGHYLLQLGVGLEEPVGICLEREWGLVVGMLGILKAGGAYVPLDPDYPLERLEYMLSDTGAKVVISSRGVSSRLPGGEYRVIWMDEWEESMGREPVTLPEVVLRPDNLAYIMYTSGSTGRPKGVMVEHGNFINTSMAWRRQYDFSNHCPVVFSVAGMAFDVFSGDVFRALLNGGKVVLADGEGRLDPSYLYGEMKKHGVHYLESTPALMKNLVEHVAALRQDLSFLRIMVVGSDVCSPTDFNYLKNSCPGVRLLNSFGVTEAAVDATFFEGRPHDRAALSIGRPMDNIRCYILDEQMRLLPKGCIGEICIGGRSVARGYWGLEELTRERFVPDPYSERSGVRMYRTGDRGRWLADGNIEYLGRSDEQVKISGYRIEPGEIGNVLLESGLVRQAVVVARGDARGMLRLVGYVVPEGVLDKGGLVEYLKGRLPAYMVPVVWVELEELPLNSNGKVDKRRLPDVGDEPGEGYEAPRTDMEGLLAGIWEEVLGVDRVGVRDNFFVMGGHSLLAMRVVAGIRQVLHRTVGVKSLFVHATIRELAVYLEGLEAAGKEEAVGKEPVRREVDRPDRLPLSFGQERLWFIDRLEGSVQYHIPEAVRLKGRLDRECLERSLREIVRRHEVLRTVIREEGGSGWQVMLPWEGWELGYEEGSEAGLQDRLTELLLCPFDLSGEYMLRSTLIGLGGEEYVLVLVIHHIASDGWSSGILMKELEVLYGSYVRKEAVMLPGLAVQYGDYALWQRKHVTGALLEGELSYWKARLSGLEVLMMPVDHGRLGDGQKSGGSVYRRIGKEVSVRLRRLSQEEGGTMFMVLLAGFKVLLSRWSGQEDICVGSPVAGRTRRELEGVIGFFVNTLALRSDLGGDPVFREVLRRVRDVTLDAYEHQEAPFEKVVEAVVRERDLSRSPLFQVMFVLQNTPDQSPVRLEGLQLSPVYFQHSTATFDLSFTLVEEGKDIHLLIRYAKDLYEDSTVQRMADHYVRLLSAASESPDMRISRLPMLGEEELRGVLEMSKGEDIVYDREKTLVDLFVEQVLRTPEAVALVSGEVEMSYRELEDRSNQLGHYLLQLGVGPEEPVGICLERGWGQVVGMLGILKAGGAYVPLDPDYPMERLEYMLSDTGAKVVISSRGVSSRLPEGECRVIWMDEWEESMGREPVTLPEVVLKPDNLAYIMYTSGSTGRPKGVMIMHRSVINLVVYQQKELEITGTARVLQFSNYCFDVSVEQIYLALLNGAVLVLVTKEIILDTERMGQFIAQQRITHLYATPGYLGALEPRYYPYLERVIAGGEVCSRELSQRWGKTAVFYNEYGPTETTVVCIEYRCLFGKGEGSLPIGRPMGNVRVYIVDKGGALAPVGVAGEICVGGDGVARGYLGLEELTRKCFVPDPYSERAGARMYRTGDRGRWLPDGNIEYMGRSDEQVKISGYRIEPGEIGNVLLESGLVRQAVVVARGDAREKLRLVGYVVVEGVLDKGRLVEYLKGRLPAYMVPVVWVELGELPLNSNGKVDKRLLPDVGDEPVEGYEAPRTEVEGLLAGIWGEVLGIDRVGVRDNFFVMGGHSLLAMRVVAGIRQVLQRTVGVKSLFVHATIRELAVYLEGLEAAGKEEADGKERVMKEADRPERLPLSFGQERLWFIDRLEGSVQYHIPEAVRLKGSLDRECLERSLREIVRRHEVLRTVIREEGGSGWQVMLPWEGWELGYEEGSEGGLQDRLTELLLRPFDLSGEYMLRSTLIGLGREEYVLVMVIHHIASDGWSSGILMKELELLYRSYVRGEPVVLAGLAVQYGDYALWQRKHVTGALLEGELSYWKARLSGLEVLMMPVDHERLGDGQKSGGSVYRRIGKEVSVRLRRLSQEEGGTMFMVLLAGFKVLLSRWSGQEDICVGSPVAGRTRRELEGVIGFFVNTLALRSDLGGDPVFREVLRRVRDVTLDAYEHQETPFEKVVEAVVRERDLSRNPLFQVMFVLQNTPDQSPARLEGLQLSPVLIRHRIATFDLMFGLVEEDAGLNLFIEYAKDLYEEGTVQRMADHYVRLLSAASESPDMRISRLPTLGEEELRGVLEMSRGEDVAYDREKTLVDLFGEQVLRTPEAVALVSGEVEVSYRELEDRSNRLGHYLLQLGVGLEEPVGICLEREWRLVVGMLGILKAGGAYVPLDPDYPSERLEYILSDTGAKVVISSRGVSSRLPEGECRVIWMDEWEESMGREPVMLPEVVLRPDNLAYIMYTSGSTGRPKGVMIDHRNINCLVMGGGYISLTSTDIVLATGSPSFDAVTFEYWGTLLNGGRLVLCRKETLLDVRLLKAAIARNRPNKMWFITGWFNQLVDTDTSLFEGLEEVITGGEKISVQHVRKIYQAYPGITLLNVYGPTENTTFSTMYRVIGPYDGESIPIGKPLGNRSVYIAGQGGALAPVGVAGEICVGGDGVARGYWGLEELTRERFVPDLYSERSGVRVYRTGDRGRWLADGNIEYLGRSDEQVKISGYRIEPGEIGNVLLESGLVRQAVVVARGDARGMLRLVGYVVPEGVLDKGGLVEYLKGRLPAYMVPVVWVELEELPLNSNGKVDKRRLPDVGDEPREGYEAPRTEMEGLLAGIWGEVLGVDRVGVRDNFFDLGGNSLVMLPLLSKIRGVSERVSLKDLFVYQTIERLAAWMDKNAGGGSRRETGLVSGGHLISLHEGDSSATLFIVPGSQGFSDGYDELAKAFGDRHAVYGIQMMGSREGEEPIRDIPEIAKQNIRWIKTVQPDGPYRFVAHCFGAHVAYEMTRQLESGGEEVAFTALLDISVDLDRLGITGTVIPLECMMTTLRRLLYAFGFMEDWGDEGLAWMGEFSARLEAIPEDDRPAVIGRCLRDRYPQRQEMVDFIMRLFNLEMTNILVNYVPSGRIVSPLVIVRAEEEDWHGYGESLGWHAFSDKCHVMTAPGTHDSMVRSAHAIVLVQRLLKIIEEFVIRSEGF